ncbi:MULTISPECIES: hypothetical protein [Herbaspirillum]|uniref:hypothetical protein n=1 Tax=Herbaspirillum TaxID=963 RepID=UPI00098092B5|nr:MULTISPECIES: hypothetical protein [Herbaspirillum]ONN65615.1 hypothetical protein BTM36_16775 [Herbaspirillum sp. VT-16-41]UIN23602.1 hypothetical protein LAZ82_11105 [Herbaspirillum frisingense]
MTDHSFKPPVESVQKQKKTNPEPDVWRSPTKVKKTGLNPEAELELTDQLPLGDAMMQLSKDMGLRNEDVEAILATLDRRPAEPMKFD